MLHGAFGRAQIVDLVLGEEGDLQTRRPSDGAALLAQALGEKLGEGGLAVAVLAEQGDPVLGVNPQIEA